MPEAYASATPTLLKMAGNDQEHADRALAAGAERIDEAFAAGGYVTPLDIASLPEDPPTALDAKTRITKQLEYADLSIAAWVLSSPVDAKQGTPTKVKKDYDEIMKWLALIAEGKLKPPALSALGGSASGTGMRIVGDELWGYNAEQHVFAHLNLGG